MNKPPGWNGAVTSTDGRYRYLLWRRLMTSGRCVVFVMLNPSTADAYENDPTIRRCMSFAMSINAALLQVVNLYALRATDPKLLFSADDPIGPNGGGPMAGAMQQADKLVFAWGGTAAPKKQERVKDIWAIARAVAHVKPMCFGLTSDGSPRHPLYVRNTAELVEFREAAP